MSYVSKGFAKAETPFGPLSGHTHIEVTDAGNDSAVIDFRCGHTPVRLVVAGANYLDLVRALIDKASPHRREELNDRLEHVLEAIA
jgi:hypothetical protein